MTPERWQQIRDVLEKALELASEQRFAFLNQTCSADPTLRDEVDTLLASSDHVRSSFLESPPLSVTLTPGTKLGEYEIVSLVGSGGMGEVYRARDARLGREVAIKVLPTFFAADTQRLRRFEQEARAAAALNHPNILAVFQMGTHQGAPYLVSELLEGETLRGLLKRGRQAVHKAIDYAVQVARGLAAAHEKGIVHRDLKPENLFVTRDGRVKILDFGLAKLTQRQGSSDPGAPTVGLGTEAGVVMGTVGYMAPEQVRGETADHRADIFSFGAILYEMLTGTRAFQKPTSAETMTAILNEDPPSISQVTTSIPAGLQRVVHRCLEKNPEQRFQSASDLAFALDTSSESSGYKEAVSSSHATGSAVIAFATQRKWRTATGIVAALVALGAAGYGVYSLLHRANQIPFPKLTITQITNSGKAVKAAISPDGRYVLSVISDNGLESLWLHSVPTRSDTQVLPSSRAHYEFISFSPDGNYIYFRKADDAEFHSVYRFPILGGTPQRVLRDVDSELTFSPDGQHFAYFRMNAPEKGKYSLLRSSLEGGDEKTLRIGSMSLEWPVALTWLHNGEEIAYSLQNLTETEQALGAIDVVDVRTGKSRRWTAFREQVPYEIRSSRNGGLFVLYAQKGANFRRVQIGFLRSLGAEIEAITRDTNRYRTLSVAEQERRLATVLSRSNATVLVLSQLGHNFGKPRQLLSALNEYGEVSWLRWSADGNLLLSSAARLLKVAVDGQHQVPLLADPRAEIFEPSACGPDYLVLTWALHDGTNTQRVWRTNADGSNPVKLTEGKFDRNPLCSPDHKWVYYTNLLGNGSISRLPVDGSGKAELLFTMPQGYSLWDQGLSMSPDGKTLAVIVDDSSGKLKIAVFDLTSARSSRLLDTSHCSGHLQFTPDGKSVAYTVQQNGVDNIWEQPLDGSPGNAITDFKSEQIWSFSLSPDGKSLAVLCGHWDFDVVLLQEPE